MITFKEQVYAYYTELAAAKVAAAKQALEVLQESIALETKSTAGDKYETARAMIHMEQERCTRQLAEAKALLQAMQQIDPLLRTATVVKGSLVYTAGQYFLVSAGLGKAEIDGKTCFAISPVSPIGQAFAGCEAGTTVQVSGKTYLIEALW